MTQRKSESAVFLETPKHFALPLTLLIFILSCQLLQLSSFLLLHLSLPVFHVILGGEKKTKPLQITPSKPTMKLSSTAEVTPEMHPSLPTQKKRPAPSLLCIILPRGALVPTEMFLYPPADAAGSTGNNSEK